MSRCYPYPPPGYQKKAQLPDVNVPAKVFPKEKKKNKEKEKEKDKEKEKEKRGKDEKEKEKEKEKKLKEVIHKEKKEGTGEKDKEKHRDKRDKNKKEKRKKDGETNGIGHDKDPRSSKLQRTSHANNVLHSNEENGRVRETAISAAVASPLERDGRDAAKPRDSVVVPASHPPSVYITKEQQSNGKVARSLPPVVLSKSLGGSPPDVDAAPSTRPSNHNHLIESSQKPKFSSQRPQKLPDFSICDNLPPLASWSTLDDEHWLLPSSERLHSQPKAERVEEDTAPEVWAEAVYLPSVDMYALPYVVPY